MGNTTIRTYSGKDHGNVYSIAVDINSSQIEFVESFYNNRSSPLFVADTNLDQWASFDCFEEARGYLFSLSKSSSEEEALMISTSMPGEEVISHLSSAKTPWYRFNRFGQRENIVSQAHLYGTILLLSGAHSSLEIYATFHDFSKWIAVISQKI